MLADDLLEFYLHHALHHISDNHFIIRLTLFSIALTKNNMERTRIGQMKRTKYFSTCFGPAKEYDD